MENFVIIDIGSNSVRMAIYRIEPDGTYFEIKRMKNDARLSKGIGEHNLLQQSSIDETIEALKSFQAVYANYANVVVQAIATAAVRQSNNQESFLNQVKRQTGIQVRVLSGDEEAYYDFMGMSTKLKVRDYLLMDVGGASVELVHVRNREGIHFVSVPIGAVRISEKFKLTDRVSSSNFFSAQAYITEMFSQIPWLVKPEHYPIVLIGGAARSLARINRKHQHLNHIDQIQNYQLTRKQINGTMKLFLNRSFAERQKICGLESSRADVIIGGALCLTTMMNFIDSKRVIFSNGGVREGIINEYMENNPKYQ